MSSLWMFPALIAAILTGFPAAFAMLIVAVAFGLGTLRAAVPLFIFMGAMFEQSGIAQRLFDAIHMWTRRIAGGLAVGTVLMCVVFAATSGIIGATESIVGLLAIPAMLKYRYDKS